MKAFVVPDEDSPATYQDVPVPEPGPGDVRVAVKASSVNGFDVFVASGMAKGMMEHRYPVVVGKDYAGVVDAVGEGVERFSVGDEVTGIAPPEEQLGRGSFAEYIVVPVEGFIEPKPSTLSFEQAACVGLAALTALVAVDAVDPSEGSVVLVTGATGGVGSYAVQIAASRGATVIATGLPEDEEWVRSLGASEVVSYRDDVAEVVEISKSRRDRCASRRGEQRRRPWLRRGARQGWWSCRLDDGISRRRRIERSRDRSCERPRPGLPSPVRTGGALGGRWRAAGSDPTDVLVRRTTASARAGRLTLIEGEVRDSDDVGL